MNFSQALELLKSGDKLVRTGWNGSGMWVALGGNPVELSADKFWNEHAKSFAECNDGKAVVASYFILKTVGGDIQMGWTPTSADLLADDWAIA